MPHSMTMIWEHDGHQIAKMRVRDNIERPADNLLVDALAIWMKEKIRDRQGEAQAAPATPAEG